MFTAESQPVDSVESSSEGSTRTLPRFPLTWDAAPGGGNGCGASFVTTTSVVSDLPVTVAHCPRFRVTPYHDAHRVRRRCAVGIGGPGGVITGSVPPGLAG